MKSDEILEAVEGVETAIVTDAKKARGWLRSAWNWAWNTSWKTKTAFGVVVLTGLLFGMTRAGIVSENVVSRADVVKAMNVATDAAQKAAAARSKVDETAAQVHQMRIELNAVEEKLAEPKPAPIETGSVKKSKKRH